MALDRRGAQLAQGPPGGTEPAWDRLLVRVQMVVGLAEEARALVAMGDTEQALELQRLAARQLDDPELAARLPAAALTGLRVAVGHFLRGSVDSHPSPVA